MDTYQRLPLKLIKGKGVWIWDDKGNKYLDAVAGIATCSLGHSNKKLSKVLSKQLNTLQHISNLYEIAEQEELGKWLVEKSCTDKAFFCNSGAEANEAAIKLAKKHGKLKRNLKDPIILCAKSSFHGRTIAALSATGQPKYQRDFEPLLQGFEFFTFNEKSSFEKLHRQIEINEPRIAAVLIEPIQGEGGIHLGEVSFFQSIREYCNKHNILLIFDEVQSGMGRTGKLWAYEHLNIEPDILTLAKGLGGGHAIGALLVKEHANTFTPGDHASTFGGNPFACKAALTVAHEIENQKLLDNASARGAQLKDGLLSIIDEFPSHFEEARGLGLMQGLAIKECSHLNSQILVEEAIKERLLIIGAGSKVIRFVPALTINKKEINQLLKRFHRTICKLHFDN